MLRDDRIDLILNDIKTNTRLSESVKEMKSYLVRTHKFNEIAQKGMVQTIIQLLDHDDEDIVSDACWILSNVLTMEEYTTMCVENGVIDQYFRLVEKFEGRYLENTKLVHHLIFGLGNIAIDCVRFRDMLHQRNLVDFVVSVIAIPIYSETASWVLSNLVREKPYPPFEVTKKCIPCLGTLLMNDNEEVISESLWCLSYLTDGTHQNIQEIVKAGLWETLISFLSRENKNFLIPALKAIGNILRGHISTSRFIKNTLLPALAPLILHESNQVRIDALWNLSNIATGPRSHISILLNDEILKQVIQILNDDDLQVRIKKECSWVLSSIVNHGTATQCLKLGRVRHCLSSLIKFIELSSLRNDVSSIERCAECISCFLQCSQSCYEEFVLQKGIETFEAVYERGHAQEKMKEVLKCFPKKAIIHWSKCTDRQFPRSTHNTVDTLLMLSSVRTDYMRSPRFPSEGNALHFWCLPKEILFVILGNLTIEVEVDRYF